MDGKCVLEYSVTSNNHVQKEPGGERLGRGREVGGRVVGW